MAPQSFTTTAQYEESDHMLATDDENDEEFAPNREIGDGLRVSDRDISQSNEEAPEEERHFDYTPL